MHISTRLSLGFAACGLLVIACVGAGWWGVRSIEGSLASVSGPAWHAARGSMQADIAVGKEMVVVAAMIAQGTSDAKAAAEAAEATNVALHEVTSAGVLHGEVVETVSQKRVAHMETTKTLLDAHARWVAARDQFDATTTEFVAFGRLVEVVGDSQVEVIQNNPEQAFTWNGGLGKSWEAADGGMESNIGLLTALYHLQRCVTGADIASCRAGIDEGLSFLKEASDSMLATGLFDVPCADDPATPMSTRYRAQFAQFGSELNAFYTRTIERRAADARYQQTGLAFSKAVKDLASAGEHTMNEEASTASMNASTAATRVMLLGMGALVMCALAAVLISRAIITPLRVVSSALAEIASGDGDLTRRLDESRTDELGVVARNFNAFVKKIGHSIAAIEHALGFPVGRGHAAAVEVVAPDDQRRFDGPRADKLVERQACFGAFAIAKPADAGGQSLKLNARLRHLDPPPERGVFGEERHHCFVGLPDVFRIAGERHPPERALALAEEWADVGRYEAWKRKCSRFVHPARYGPGA